MRRRSASVVVVETPLEERRRLTLRKKKKGKEKKGNEIEVMDEESVLVREEKSWLHRRLEVGLEKTRSVLDAVKSDAFAHEGLFDELLEMQSLKTLLNALNAMGSKKESLPEQVFMSMFTDEEWSELQASEEAIADADEGKLRLLRLNRQYNLFWDAQSFVIDLTVRDENVAGEQSKLVNDCMQVVNVVLDRMGLNGRRRVALLLPLSPAPAQRVKRKESTPVRVARVKQKEAMKVKSNSKKKVVKKREGRSQEAEEEVEEEVVQKRAKKASEDEENDENEDQEGDEAEGEDDDDEEEEAVAMDEDEEEMVEEEKVDVDVVLKMLKERNKQGGLTLKVSKIDVPDSKCASPDAGLTVLLDDVKLSQCLCDNSSPDEWHAVEQWGILMKWWRLVNRCFAITGIFAHLRAQKRNGDLNLRKRYGMEVARLKEKVYSYSQAAIYDRLGRFLLQYPRFMFQLQLVTLTDWLQDVGGKMITCLDDHLSHDDENGKLWKEIIISAEEAPNHSPPDLASYSVASSVASAPGSAVLSLSSVLASSCAAAPSSALAPGSSVSALSSHSLTSASASASTSTSASASASASGEECLVCKTARIGPESELWQCSRCDGLFHEMCMGYQPETICEDIVLQNGVVLETHVYCTDCLFDKELTVDDVAKAIQEVKAVGNFINAPDCKFVLEKIREDGFCCFRILENAARKLLKWKGDQAKFCREVARAAVVSAETAAKEIGGDVLESEALNELRSFARQANPVDSLHNGKWKSLEVHYIFQGFVNMFPGRVAVNVYQAANGQVRNTTNYGKGDVQVKVLHWNMMQHYDCLIVKK
jgi:hypothetical protein